MLGVKKTPNNNNAMDERILMIHLLILHIEKPDDANYRVKFNP